MGGALIKGWYRQGLTESLTAVARKQVTLDALVAQCPGIHVTLNGQEAVKDANMVVVAVKPWMVQDVVAYLLPCLQPGKQILVSIAAGIDNEKLQQWIGPGAHTCYAMPNIAAEYGQAMSFVIPSGNLTADETRQVIDLFAKVGKVQCCDKRTLNAGNMMAGCGIAYVMRFIQAMMEGGVEMGLYPRNAREIAMQAMQGAVTLLGETGMHPAVAIDKVTTPGGLAIRGLNEMDHAGFNSAVIRALKAGLD